MNLADAATTLNRSLVDGRPSNAEIRQGVADRVDDLHQLRMGLFKTSHGGGEAVEGMLEQRGIFFLARGFVRGDGGETGDALRLLGIGLGQLRDLGLQRAQQAEQLRPVVTCAGTGLLELGFNFSDGFLNHNVRVSFGSGQLQDNGGSEK